jgi:inner membrane protein
VIWRGELALPISELVQLAQTHCEFAAFLRYARVPWSSREAGQLIVGDLRYDREPGLGFAELALDPVPASCPRFVPPWRPPRSDLLRLGPPR